MKLELDHLAAGYNGHGVLHDLSLTLEEGRIGCLLGPSGSGKTTALRCIAGLERPTHGRILGDDRLLSSPDRQVPPERRGIGMVFQDLALLPHLCARDNIGFGLHGMTRAERARRVAAMLELVGLGNLQRAFPHELSGGQQQRIALARALAPSPRLLLLDEPFSSLDVELRERLPREVRAILAETRTTALLVTHSQHEAFAMADIIGVMRAGRLHQWDNPYTLYHRPADRFVAGFVGEGVLLPAQVRDGMLQMELGRLAVPAGCVASGAADVLLRPDDIVHDDASPLQAVVESKAFRGADILYTLRLPSGAEVLSLVPSHHNHAIGGPIGIRLDLEHLILFPQG